MVDSKILRVVDLAQDEDNKDKISSNKLAINTLETIPLIYANTTFLETVSYGLTQTDTLDSTNNTIVDVKYKDDNDEDRFIYINKINSLISGSYVRLYYDKKYQDIIVIPDTYLLGLVDSSGGYGTSSSTEDDPVINNIAYEINGYIIGSSSNNNRDYKYGSFIASPTDNVGNNKLPATKDNVDISIQLYKLYGLSSNVNNNINKMMSKLDDDNVYVNKITTPSQIITLGDPGDLFEEVKPLPLYNIFQYEFNTYGIKYDGYKKPDDSNDNFKLAILLNF